MQKVFKYKNGKIKVMYNDQIMLKDYEEEILCNKIMHKTKSVSKAFTVGVELMAHKGGRICYGMLIAQVRPYTEQDSVNITIAFTHKNIIRYRDSILLNDEFVYKGLPEEYVSEMNNRIEQSIKEKEIYPQYDISFGNAANCEVGSSPMIFAYIAEIIMEMLYADEIEEIFNMDIATFTQKYVKNIKMLY